MGIYPPLLRTVFLSLKLGWIPYQNLAPLRIELMRQLGADLNLREGHPTQVNRWLSEGEIDVSPSSSVCLLRNKNHEIACHVGVASDGAVKSVYIGFPRAQLPVHAAMTDRIAVLGDIIREASKRSQSDSRGIAQGLWRQSLELEPVSSEPPILRMTKASATSCGLAKFIYRQCFGEAATRSRILAQDGVYSGEKTLPEITLLIGDEALQRRGEFAAILDLGAVWKTMTGLPFVFAIWQRAGKTVPESFIRQVFKAADIAQARMQVEPGVYLDQLGIKGDQQRQSLAEYWDGLHYRLTSDDMRGLCLFLALVKPLLKLDVNADASAKIMRWQQAADHLQLL